MLGVIDYGYGNVGSVLNMFSKVGVWAEIVDSPEKIKQMKAIILPGVGAFDTGVKELKERGFWDAIKYHVEVDKKNILGVCLGMQLLFEGSEEGELPGFGWLPGKVERFDASVVPRIPHIGWQPLQIQPLGESLFEDIQNPEYYFVHAYHAPRDLDVKHVAAYCHYGYSFPASVKNNNVLGMQFHPEKSLGAGMSLLKNFYTSIT